MFFITWALILLSLQLQIAISINTLIMINLNLKIISDIKIINLKWLEINFSHTAKVLKINMIMNILLPECKLYKFRGEHKTERTNRGFCS